MMLGSGSDSNVRMALRNCFCYKHNQKTAATPELPEIVLLYTSTDVYVLGELGA